MLTITRKKPTYASGVEKNGQELVLLPASKKAFEEISEAGGNMGKNTAEQMKTVYLLLAIILNTNDKGISVAEDEAAEIDPVTAMTIIKEYTAFMRGLKNDPNS